MVFVLPPFLSDQMKFLHKFKHMLCHGNVLNPNLVPSSSLVNNVIEVEPYSKCKGRVPLLWKGLKMFLSDLNFLLGVPIKSLQICGSMAQLNER